MIKIAPSILSADFANLERDIQRISTADYVHVDVMDGVFVPNISIGIPVVKSIRPTTSLPLDVHLMIVEPVRYVEQFCDAGADLVTVHVEADTEENIRAAIDKIHARGKRAGIVLKPQTPAEAALPFLEKVELILVMTVEPGFGGQSFMADMMPKVSALRKLIDTPASWRWTAAWPRRPARPASTPGPTCWWPAAPCTRRRIFRPASPSCGESSPKGGPAVFPGLEEVRHTVLLDVVVKYICEGAHKIAPFNSFRLERSIRIVLVCLYQMLLSRDMEKNYGIFS